MASLKHLKWLQQLTWVLIYGGLLTLVLGLSVARTDEAAGWCWGLVGAALALLGVLLIYLRSRLKVD
jgi:hypothetical protein